MATAAIRALSFPALSYGQAEFLKWVAFVLMVNEHVARYIVLDDHGLAYQIGRVVFPIFGFVLAYNLGRNWRIDVVRRVAVRLFIFGVIAQPFSIYLTGSPRLNVLFTLLSGLLLSHAFLFRGSERWVWGPLAIVLGPFVEFDLMGVAYVAAVVAWSVNRSVYGAGLTALALMSLYLPNGNWFALAAIPLVMFAAYLPFELPRVRGLFYWLYPAHFALLSAVLFFAP